MNDLLNLELRNSNLKISDQAWGETWMTMEIGPDMVLLAGLHNRQLERWAFMKHAFVALPFG